MNRFFLFFIVLAAISWSIYSGYELITKSNTAYAPEYIFSEEDKGVLQINRLTELQKVNFLDAFSSNQLLAEVKATDWKKIGVEKLFLSLKRPLVIVEINGNWSKTKEDFIKSKFHQKNTSFNYEGKYLLIANSEVTKNNLVLTFFSDADKKASANFWELLSDKSWKRTDVYALKDGYFEYKSSATTKNIGNPVDDIHLFSSVLPQNIETYRFYERFYAKENDTIFANNPMFDWTDKGFVKCTYKGEEILITDYQSQQLPSLILLEKTSNEDSVIIADNIKSFTGFQLTTDFPKKEKGRIYVLEIEDKSLITENKQLAESISLTYNLGETLALNEAKREQFFGGLPTATNFRYVGRESKKSMTWKSNFIFEVSTVPLGDNLLMNTTSNWSFNPNYEKIDGFIPIIDHIRGGYSLFVHDEKGNYSLLSQTGSLLWSGIVDSAIIQPPKVIDIYDNGKHQLLFATAKIVYLIDLNGNNVAHFPVDSDYTITTKISTLVWKGTLRFLFGNSKGELVMLNNTGQELNVVQVSNNALKNEPFALNIQSNLRAWAIDDVNNTFLAYLETPAKTQGLGKTKAKHFIKSGVNIVGFYTTSDKTYSVTMKNDKETILGEGKLIDVNKRNIILQKGNEIFIYNTKDKDLKKSQRLKFAEIGQVEKLVIDNDYYVAVYDYLENNIHLFNELGESVKGFPKESRGEFKMVHNEQNNLIEIFTHVNRAVVCYKVSLEEMNE